MLTSMFTAQELFGLFACISTGVLGGYVDRPVVCIRYTDSRLLSGSRFCRLICLSRGKNSIFVWDGVLPGRACS